MGPKTPGRREKLAAKAAQLEAQRREQEEKEELERQEQERLLQLEREREAKRKKEETEMIEKSIRDESLLYTCDFFHDLKEKNFRHLLQMREHREWERHLACDRLPYPNDVPSMNTYLYLWTETGKTGRMESVLEKNEAMIALLGILEDYIDEPLDASGRKLNNWKEVRENYRAELRKKLDLACFHMIRNVEARFNKVSYWESEYEKSSANIHLWMWIWMMKSITTSTAAPPPAKNFGTVTVKLPASFAHSPLSLRLLHTTYDHYSDQCHTWDEPRNPIDHDLYDETTMWHDIKVDIISENFQSLQIAEEIPCWFEVPDEDLYFEEETPEFCESVGLSGQETNRSFEENESYSDNRDDADINCKMITETHKKELIESIVENKGKTKTKISKNMSVLKEEIPSSSNENNIYVGNLPIPGRPEIYKITSEGEIDIIRTDGGVKIESEEEDWNLESEFEDWMSLSDPMELEDEMEIFEILYNGGKHTSMVKTQKQLKTLPDLLREVSPKTGDLATLNLSEDVRKYLAEILGITIASERKRTAEYDYEEETVSKSLSQHLEEARVRYMDAYKKELKIQVEEKELNLRKFAILGGVYHIDLIKQVPQPHKHQDGTTVQINYGDYNINKEVFFFKYVPPIITEEEENEEEDGKAPIDEDIDKLISVDIQVPDTVLWFETPAPYLWDEENKMWSSENIYDPRFNEEKQTLSFRIGKTSPIGVATFRYYNLPYQTWEIRPAADWKESKSIIFSLTASTVIVEYLIRADKVSLNSVQNATGAALDSILGTPYPPNQLIRIMRQAGLDLFPGWDAFLYVEGNCAKKKVLEEHVYLSMAMLAPSCQYTWSRWNMPAGPDRIIFQMREHLKPKEQGSYKMVLNTSNRAVLVNCTEVSPSFSDDPASNIGFKPDLFGLLQSTASERAKKRAKKANTDVLFTLYYMLRQTKLFSFS